MKASTIIRTVFALSVLLFPMSCEGDEILLNIDEETGEIETTTQADPLLSWSAKTYEATLGAENSFPTLTNKYGVTVSYSSSDESTAAISSSGELTLVAAGTTTISATFAGDDTYKAASASYTLVVTSEADEGAGSFSYSSSGDPSSEDDISNTTFTRMITVTYSGSTASITGDHYGYVSTSGANVTVNNTGTENIIYKLTGSSTKGSFKLYSSKKHDFLYW